jgi:hypothetical protein
MSERQHLEKLIFEVYGAEEGKRKIAELTEEEEKHAKSLKGLQKQAKDTAKAEKDSAKAAEEAAKKRAESAKMLGGALAALAAASIKAASDLEAAQGRYERAVDKAGTSTEAMTAALASADKQARKNGIGLIQTRDSLAKLIEATGDMAVAQADYALAQDIAATGDMNLEQAVQALTNARKGEIEELKKLRGLNRQQMEALMGIADQGTRAEEAISKLSKAYSGAADDLRGTEENFSNLKESGTELLAIIGDTGKGLVNSFSQLFGIIGPGQDLLSSFTGGFAEFTRQAREASDEFQTYVEARINAGVIATPDEIMAEYDRLKNASAGSGSVDRTARTPENVGKGMSGRGRGRGKLDTTPKPKSKPKSGGSRERDDGSGAIVGGEYSTENILNTINSVPSDEQRAAEAVEQAEERKRAARNATAQAQQAEYDRQMEAAADIAAMEAKTAQMVEESGKAAKDAAKAKADARKTSVQTANMAAAAGASLAGAFIKDEGAKALISAGLETAKGISAAVTPGMQASAVGYFAAAAQYAAVAAQAGVGGAKRKGKKGGGASPRGGSGGGGLAAQRERVSLDSEQSRSRETRQAQTHVVNIHSTFAPSPEDSRRLVDTVEREMLTRTRRGN